MVSEKDFFRLVARVAGPTLQDEQRQLPVVGCQFSEEQAPKGFVGSKGLFTRLKPGAPTQLQRLCNALVSGIASYPRSEDEDESRRDNQKQHQAMVKIIARRPGTGADSQSSNAEQDPAERGEVGDQCRPPASLPVAKQGSCAAD